MFDGRPAAQVEIARVTYCDQLDEQIADHSDRWKERGAFVAISNITAWFAYGSDNNTFGNIFVPKQSSIRGLTMSQNGDRSQSSPSARPITRNLDRTAS